MVRASATSVAQSFLAVLWGDEPPPDAELLAAVDRLLAGVHDVPHTEPDDAIIDRPERNWASLYKEVAARFPTFGHYAVASPLALDETAITGDPIDDLADITSDLREVVWRDQQCGPDEAAWYFHFLYETHWGRHARELAMFLHARLTDPVS